MKKITLILFLFVSFFNNAQTGPCRYFSTNGDDATGWSWSPSENPYGISPHLMWGWGVNMIADELGSGWDRMSEYDGAINFQMIFRSTTSSSSYVVANPSTPFGNLYNGHLDDHQTSSADILSDWVHLGVAGDIVKNDHPYLLDYEGKFIVEVIVKIKSKWYHILCYVYTDYHYKFRQDFGIVNDICPGTLFNASTGWDDPYSTWNPSTFTVTGPATAAAGTNNYTVNPITTLNDTITLSVNTSRNIGFQNSCTYPNYNECAPVHFWNGTGFLIHTTQSIAARHTLRVVKNYKLPVHGFPSITTAVYNAPNPVLDPLWSNSPDVNLNDRITSISNYTSWYASGASVSSNTGVWYFDPSVGNGIHTITFTASNQNFCYSSSEIDLWVYNWPGVPAKPSLDYVNSFNLHTDSVYGAPAGGSCLPPYTIDDGVSSIQDNNYYERQKWLCPNGLEDSLTLKIEIVSGLTYTWRRVLPDGTDISLGTGTTKKIPRMHHPNPLPGQTTYKEIVYFKSTNGVGLTSPEEYVILEYPLQQYKYDSYNTDSSLHFTDTVCYDPTELGGSGHQYAIYDNYPLSPLVSPVNFMTANDSRLFLTDTITNSLFWQNYVSAPAYVYNPMTQSLYGTSTQKVEKNKYKEKYRLVGFNYPCAAWSQTYNYCDCDSRDFEIKSVTTPFIESFSVAFQPVSTIPLGTAPAATVFSIDATMNSYGDQLDSVLTYIGNVFTPAQGYPVVSSAIGSPGDTLQFHYSIEDQYGCYMNSLDYFPKYSVYVIDTFTVIFPPVDTLNSTPINEVNGVCFSGESENYIITPNGDNKNESLSACDHNVYVMNLFDRWGNQVIVKSNLEDINWTDFISGTYFYFVQDTGINGFIEIKK